MSVDLASRYTASYCEENIWHLCGDCAEAGIEAYAVFISNADRAVAVWQQRASRHPDAPVLWDYHVILIAWIDAHWRVYDPDSRLAAGQLVGEYVETSMPILPPTLDRHAPRFRVVEASRYRARLATDRSHMREPDGGWRSPPPPFPTIGEGTNLMRFVDMQADFEGELMHRSQLLARFAE